MKSNVFKCIFVDTYLKEHAMKYHTTLKILVNFLKQVLLVSVGLYI